MAIDFSFIATKINEKFVYIPFFFTFSQRFESVAYSIVSERWVEL